MLETHGSLIAGKLEYLRRPVAANVGQGSKVLVLTDTAYDPRLWQAVMTILADLGADATLAMFEPRPADYYDPPIAVCEAMQRVDVNVLLAFTGMLHCDANARAMAAGIPAICMDGGMTLDMFQSGGVTENMAEMVMIISASIAMALIRGVQREDKNIYGAMHFGIGTNVDVGGTIHSPIHMDGVVLQPTLYGDGELRIKMKISKCRSVVSDIFERTAVWLSRSMLLAPTVTALQQQDPYKDRE